MYSSVQTDRPNREMCTVQYRQRPHTAIWTVQYRQRGQTQQCVQFSTDRTKKTQQCEHFCIDRGTTHKNLYRSVPTGRRHTFFCLQLNTADKPHSNVFISVLKDRTNTAIYIVQYRQRERTNLCVHLSSDRQITNSNIYSWVQRERPHTAMPTFQYIQTDHILQCANFRTERIKKTNTSSL